MEQNRFRCHISIVFEKIWAVVAFLLLTMINNIKDVIESISDLNRLKENGMELYAGLGLVLLALVLYVGIYLIRWAKTWIMFEDESIVIERNTLNRKVNTIGMKNISNVNLEQNLFQRLIHVYQVKLDTNSASTADTTDVSIVLGEKQARAFQKRILEHIDGGSGYVQTPEAEGDAKRSEPVSGQHEADAYRQITYSGKDVITHCLSTLSIFWLIAAIVSIGGGIYSLISSFSEKGNLLEAFGGLFAIWAFAAAAVWKLIGNYFKLYGFSAKRAGDKIYLSYGLLKKREYMIPVNKINSVIVCQNMVARLLKRQYVELVCVGLGDEQDEGAQIMLACKREEMLQHMQTLLPEYMEELKAPLNLQKKCSIICKIPSYLIWLGIYAAALGVVCAWKPQYFHWELLVFVVICIWNVFCEILRYHTVGISCSTGADDTGCTGGISIASGTFEKRVVYIRYDKLQILKQSQGPLYRRFGLYKGEVHILAAALNSVFETGAYPAEVFETIHQGMLASRANQI